MNASLNNQQAALAQPVKITKTQAIRIVQALVLVHGIKSFKISGVLGNRTIFNFGSISHFAPDELGAGVAVALSMAAKMPPDDKIPVNLDFEVKRVFGNVHNPISFKIDSSPSHFVSYAAAH